MENQYSHKKKCSETDKRMKFFKHLRTYLCFVGFVFIMKILLHSDINLYGVVFWWGFAVAAQYVRTFGWQGFTPPVEEQTQRRYETEDELELREEQLVESKPPQKVWRDRDLV